MLEKNNMYDQENEMLNTDSSFDTHDFIVVALNLGLIAVGVAGMISKSENVQKRWGKFKEGRQADKEERTLRRRKKNREIVVLEVDEDENNSTEEKDEN